MSFEQMISDLLNIQFLQDCCSPSIRQYQLPPQTGEGICKIIQFGTSAAIVIFDCVFLNNYTYRAEDETLLHISYFKEIHSNHHCADTERTLISDTIYAHMGACGKFQTFYDEHTPVKAVHIFLGPEFYDTYLSKKIPNSAECLKDAIAMLNQSDYFPDLSFIFHQLYNYRKTGAASLLFYESKLMETLALILQKSLDYKESLHRCVKQADIDAAHRIAEYISTHATQEISLDFLAHMTYMSPAKLKYVFKSVYHCSIRDYRLQRRMHIAKELLYHTDLPVADVAKQLGYQTSGNFAAIFKKYTGFSPKDFRVFSRHPSYTDFGSQ